MTLKLDRRKNLNRKVFRWFLAVRVPSHTMTQTGFLQLNCPLPVRTVKDGKVTGRLSENGTAR